MSTTVQISIQFNCSSSFTLFGSKPTNGLLGTMAEKHNAGAQWLKNVGDCWMYIEVLGSLQILCWHSIMGESRRYPTGDSMGSMRNK